MSKSFKDSSIKWDAIKLVCGDCVKDGHYRDMVVTSGQWGCYYSCEGYEEQSCFNRMNVDVYEKVLEKITDLLLENENINLKNHSWTLKTSYQHYKFRIIQHRPDRIVVAVVNVKKSKNH